jgi:hypothetical protein
VGRANAIAAADCRRARPGTQFACFTSTQVQILTQTAPWHVRTPSLLLIARTRVQRPLDVWGMKSRRHVSAHAEKGGSGGGGGDFDFEDSGGAGPPTEQYLYCCTSKASKLST